MSSPAASSTAPPATSSPTPSSRSSGWSSPEAQPRSRTVAASRTAAPRLPHAPRVRPTVRRSDPSRGSIIATTVAAAPTRLPWPDPSRSAIVAELAVTAIGSDRPGIVAAVTRVLHERGGNLEDSAMTILGGHFAIVLLVSTDDAPDALRDALAQAAEPLGLTISVSHADGPRRGADPTHLLSVYGADRPGIVAGVAGALAEVSANIVDLQTQLIGESDTPVYAMMIELVAEDTEVVAAAVADACEELGVDHTLRPIETETY
ncbi:MAG: hypothetical protein EA340_00955 [Nitriliruptor sp.]|nr:MAG: hypothetical protein EA340_00955 [Nitriliruptor sp.]